MNETSSRVVIPVQPMTVRENMTRGIVLSLLVAPVGIVLWVILWRMGFIASIVSFVIARAVFFLYEFGAKAPVSRKVAPFLLAVIVGSLVLAFLSGMASDALDYYIKDDTGASAIDSLMGAGFWNYFADNLFNNGQLWSDYFTDIAIAVGFAVLGSFSTVKSLFVSNR